MITLQEAYEVGKADFLSGKSDEDCPYFQYSMPGRYWLSGWVDAWKSCQKDDEENLDTADQAE